MSKKPEDNRAREVSTQVGFFLWRGGLAFCGGYLTYRSFSRVIRVLLEIGVPAQLVWGLVFVAFGILTLIASLIVERVIDARSEIGLRDM